MSKVTVVGAGYVGLTTAACMVELGHSVSVYDNNGEKISALRSNICPIFEPGLPELLAKGLKYDRLEFSDSLEDSITRADFVFLCVPTPQDADGSADLTYILSAAGAIAPLLRPGAVVATKSTVPVGSAPRIKAVMSRSDVTVVSNPEFLREGSAITDFLNPDRIVVGSDNRDASEQVANLYKTIEAPVVYTSSNGAELIKYASNAFLAMKLSFVNDLAALCERVGADIAEITNGIGLDKRIGDKFLQAGPGWGGSCFPKDTRALASIAESHGLSLPMVSAAIESNEKAHKRVLETVQKSLGGGLEGKTISIWGLAFKANTDDTRESPAVNIINRLIDRGAFVKAFDPVAQYSHSRVESFSTATEAVSGADALLVLTEWPEFSDISPSMVRSLMVGDCVYDARRILNADLWRREFTNFHVIGA